MNRCIFEDVPVGALVGYLEPQWRKLSNDMSNNVEWIGETGYWEPESGCWQLGDDRGSLKAGGPGSVSQKLGAGSWLLLSGSLKDLRGGCGLLLGGREHDAE